MKKMNVSTKCRAPLEYAEWIFQIKRQFIKAGYSMDAATRMSRNYRGLYYDRHHYVPAVEIVEAAIENPMVLCDCINIEKLRKWLKRKKMEIPRVLLYEE